MKKILLSLVLLILLVPFVVYGKTCDTNNISISSVSCVNKSATIIDDSVKTNGKIINISPTMANVGDNLEYKIVVKNNSNDDYEINNNSFNLKSDYFNYSIKSDDGSNIIKAKSSKDIYLKVVYAKEVPTSAYESGSYIDNRTMTISLVDPTANPKTGMNIYILVFIILLLVGIYLYATSEKTKNVELMTVIVLSIIILPMSINALCKYNISVKTNIKVLKNYNPCKFNGEMVQGAEYVNGQYTYRYKQESFLDEDDSRFWDDIDTDGWGITLTDSNSTSPVTTKMCTSINDKPIVSMSYIFAKSKASSVDLSSFVTSNVENMSFAFLELNVDKLNLSGFDTSKVTNMFGMFSAVGVDNLDLSGFNTSNVTSMMWMFYGVHMDSLDLSSFDTSKVTEMRIMFSNSHIESLNVSSFNTSNVIDMHGMFDGGKFGILDLSNFDTSNVITMSYMFADCDINILDLTSFDTSTLAADAPPDKGAYMMFSGTTATTGYARTQADVNRFNNSYGKPSSLVFDIKR